MSAFIAIHKEMMATRAKMEAIIAKMRPRFSHFKQTYSLLYQWDEEEFFLKHSSGPTRTGIATAIALHVRARVVVQKSRGIFWIKCFAALRTATLG